MTQWHRAEPSRLQWVRKQTVMCVGRKFSSVATPATCIKIRKTTKQRALSWDKVSKGMKKAGGKSFWQTQTSSTDMEPSVSLLRDARNNQVSHIMLKVMFKSWLLLVLQHYSSDLHYSSDQYQRIAESHTTTLETWATMEELSNPKEGNKYNASTVSQKLCIKTKHTENIRCWAKMSLSQRLCQYWVQWSQYWHDSQTNNWWKKCGFYTSF